MIACSWCLNGERKTEVLGVRAIIEYRETGMFYHEIAPLFGVYPSTIGRLLIGKSHYRSELGL